WFVRTGLCIDLPDTGTVEFDFHAAFGDVTVGADADIQIAPVGADRHGFGPVVIDFRWQVGELGWRAAGLGLPFFVVEADDGILIRYIQFSVGIGQSVWCVQVFGKHALHFVNAITISIPQQRQTIAAFDLGIALCLDVAGDDVFGFELGSTAAAPFSNDDVAIRQYQGLAWNTQVSGDGCYRIAFRYRRFLIAPGCRFCNLHVGQQAAMWLWQL